MLNLHPDLIHLCYSAYIDGTIILYTFSLCLKQTIQKFGKNTPYGELNELFKYFTKIQAERKMSYPNTCIQTNQSLTNCHDKPHFCN